MLPLWIERYREALTMLALAVVNIFPKASHVTFSQLISDLRVEAQQHLPALTGMMLQACDCISHIDRMILDIHTETSVNKQDILRHFPSPMPRIDTGPTEVIFWLAFRVYCPGAGSEGIIRIHPLIIDVSIVRPHHEESLSTAIHRLMAEIAANGLEAATHECDCLA